MSFNNLKRFAVFSILLLASAVILSAQGSVNGSGAACSTPIKLTPVFSAFIPEKTGVTGEAGLGANQSNVRDASSAYSLASVTSTPTTAIINTDSESSNTRYIGFLVARTEATVAKESTLIYNLNCKLKGFLSQLNSRYSRIYY